MIKFQNALVEPIRQWFLDGYPGRHMLAVYFARMGLLLAAIGICQVAIQLFHIEWYWNDFAFAVGVGGTWISFESGDGATAVFLYQRATNWPLWASWGLANGRLGFLP